MNGEHEDQRRNDGQPADAQARNGQGHDRNQPKDREKAQPQGQPSSQGGQDQEKAPPLDEAHLQALQSSRTRDERGKTVVVAKNLNAGYGQKVILKNVSFEVKAGEIFVILGGSGCGKSTLLKHIIGLIPPLAGTILIHGENLIQASGKKRLGILRGIGVMYQSGALFGSMSILDNVALPIEELTKMPLEAARLIARMKLELVGLGHAADLLPEEISGGMKKRAAIARAMACDPSIIFLDEPSAGLDPVTSANLDALIVKLSRDLGVTFVVVTHELASIYTIADRIIMLDRETKGIIAEGDPRDLRDHSDNQKVRQFFLREADAGA